MSNKQGVKLRGCNRIKTGNELSNFKELKNNSLEFKSNTKALNNKVASLDKKNGEGYHDSKPKYSGDQYGGNHSNNKARKN